MNAAYQGETELGGFGVSPDEAFSARYRHLFGLAMGVAARLTGDRCVSEDIAAEVLARTYDKWPSLIGRSYLEAWVAKVAANLCLDGARRRPALVRALSRVANSSSSTTTPESDLFLRSEVVAALDRLPPRQRQVVVLRYLDDLDNAEVSERLGIAPSSVRTHTQRALKALRDALDDGRPPGWPSRL